MISSESARLIDLSKVQTKSYLYVGRYDPQKQIIRKSGDDLCLILVLIASIAEWPWRNYYVQLLQIGLSSA